MFSPETRFVPANSRRKVARTVWVCLPVTIRCLQCYRRKGFKFTEWLALYCLCGWIHFEFSIHADRQGDKGEDMAPSVDHILTYNSFFFEELEEDLVEYPTNDNHDFRRCFTYGIAFENTPAQLWYCNRSVTLVTEPFDLFEVRLLFFKLYPGRKCMDSSFSITPWSSIWSKVSPSYSL